jgi:diol dehydratase reactivase alpha subunit
VKIVAGVDIGNATTEVALARVYTSGQRDFLSSAIVPTVGIKGTVENVNSVLRALEDALTTVRLRFNDLELIRLNEATPVIGDVAMETITETIVTESSMIGHNPSTPGGMGLGVGITTDLASLDSVKPGEKVIVVIDRDYGHEFTAQAINHALNRGVSVEGAIVQKDDAVLINNRLIKKIPIVDEVYHIGEVPRQMPAAVEVAQPGHSVKALSNPYGIASVFSLSPEETQAIVPMARALIGNRSAVVIKTASSEIKERRIPAGILTVEGKRGRVDVNIEEGADRILEVVEDLQPIHNVYGQPGTNVGGMMQRISHHLAELTSVAAEEIKIKDILAVDTMVQQPVTGSLADEFVSENAVALAAMVKTSRLPMEQIAKKIKSETGISVEIAGVEAEMAVLGALTTPGTGMPLAILDLGAGSTDAAIISKDGDFQSVHLAGAGEMVTMLIASELNLKDRNMAEDIKRYPVAKVESLFHIRLEDGRVRFFDQALSPKLFAKVILLKENEEMIPIGVNEPMERVIYARRKSKEKVFVTNSLRALKRIVPTGNIRLLDFVVMVGGSALDFEIPEMISNELSRHGIVAGRGNIRAIEGPRNAVATGLVLSFR